MNEPAVTVLLAVWNPDLGHLEATIRSILNQTFRDFELLVVEDPSPRSAASLVERLDDPRIRLLQRSSRGPLGEALNVGIAAARSELIARIDGDDIAVPQRLEKQVEFMNLHPEIAVYGSRISVIDEDGRVVGRRLLPLANDAIAAAFRRYNCMSHPSVMFRKSVVVAHGGYDPQILAEDYDLWCRMSLAGERFENSSDDFVQYRFHGQAAKFRGVHDSIRTTVAIKRRHFARTMGWIDRLRLFGETALLALPPSLIIRLFRLIEYRASSRRAA